MLMTSMVFSPTGGTKQVVDILLQAMDVACAEEIDLKLPNGDFKRCFQGTDTCVVGVPSYGGRVPAVVIERLKQMQGNGCRAILVCAYGNRAYEDTLIELADTLTAVGFRCVGAVAAIAQHSLMPQFASNRPDQSDKLQLQEFGKTIKQHLLQSNRGELTLPGNRPYREYGGVPLKPNANKTCTGCGLCAKQCPVGAIDKQHPAKSDASLCISCMGCVAVCPIQARKLNKLMVMGAAKAMKKAFAKHRKNEMFLSR